jgi:hypothetical protein
VLARLNLIPGVETTYASLADSRDPQEAHGASGSQGSTLIRVTLRPGANSKKVGEQVELVLQEEIRERAVEAVRDPAAVAVLQQREWLDTSQLADIAATEPGTASLLWLLLAGLVVALLGLLGWRYLRQRRAAAAATP